MKENEKHAERDKNYRRKLPVEHVIPNALYPNADFCAGTASQIDSYLPLLYLFTPTQMGDNDHKTPSYLHYVDGRVVPPYQTWTD